VISAAAVDITDRATDALRRVMDPELDESLVELGFVDSVQVVDGAVDVVLRLPTFWCAPNFAYLMAHDARQEILREPGVRSVRVRLRDHVYSDEISTGVSAGSPFDAIFPGQSEGNDLAELRGLFRAKAFGMRQEQLLRFLLDHGLSAAEIVDITLDDVRDTSDRSGLVLRVGCDVRQLRGGAPLARAYLERRSRLGLRGRYLITTVDDEPIAAAALPDHMQATRRLRVSMTFNALMCRGLVKERYGLGHREEP
jgi:metal-sulfur cluster biosynthetic enzyme